jgi:hypothetical protein
MSSEFDETSIRIASIDNPVTIQEVGSLAAATFKTFVKFVVDLNKEAVAFGGELHADAETLLLKSGSRQQDLWGGNFFPADKSIEYTALINIRPSAENAAMEVLRPELRQQIRDVVFKVIQ